MLHPWHLCRAGRALQLPVGRGRRLRGDDRLQWCVSCRVAMRSLRSATGSLFQPHQDLRIRLLRRGQPGTMSGWVLLPETRRQPRMFLHGRFRRILRVLHEPGRLSVQWDLPDRWNRVHGLRRRCRKRLWLSCLIAHRTIRRRPTASGSRVRVPSDRDALVRPRPCVRAQAGDLRNSALAHLT